VVALLLSDRIPTTQGSTLAIAAANGHHAVVALLLAKLAWTTAVCNYALHRAVVEGHTAVVELLLADARTDPTRKSQILWWPCCNGDTFTAKLLLADGRADPSARKHRVLLGAASAGHTAIVTMLLADIRIVDTLANIVPKKLVHSCQPLMDAYHNALRWRRRRALAMVREQRRAARDISESAAWQLARKKNAALAAATKRRATYRTPSAPPM
jgi:hypothetical protein